MVRIRGRRGRISGKCECNYIIDTGCKKSIIGELELGKVLGTLNLSEIKRVKEDIEEIDFSYKFGEISYKGSSRIKLPVYLGGSKVRIITDVINGNIPWIIGSEVLEKIGAEIDIKNKIVKCNNIEPVERLPIMIDKKGYWRINLRGKIRMDKVWLNLRKENMLGIEKEWRKVC